MPLRPTASLSEITKHRRTASATPGIGTFVEPLGVGTPGTPGTQGRGTPLGGGISGSEEDESTPRRTRSKIGPLPPNGPSNPLFPPLPPKIPRIRHSGGRGSRSGSERRSEGRGEEAMFGEEKREGGKGGERDEMDDWDEKVMEEELDREEKEADEVKMEFGMASEPIEPSNPPLSPPSVQSPSLVLPPTVEEATTTDNTTMTTTTNPHEEGSDEWEAYTKRRAGRAFGRSRIRKEDGGLGGEDKVEVVGNENVEMEVDTEVNTTEVNPEADNTQVKLEPSTSLPLDTIKSSSSPSLTESFSSNERKSTRRSSHAGLGKRGKLGKDKKDELVDDDDEVDRGDVTRCVCEKDDIDVMMIQCDMCNAWQHGACVGVWGDEEAPDEYFCDICKPSLHAPLRRVLKMRAKRGEGFIPPTPQELLQNLLPSDRTKPSQSKRWMNTTANTATTTATKPHIPSPSIASGKGGVALEKRSHHRKIGRDTSPPVSATSAESRRRGVRGTPVDVPPPDITMSPVSGGNTRRKMPLPSQRRESSSPSATPPAGNAPLARKRNTMNSRDSAYDDAIAASLREIAAKEALAHGHVFEEDDDAEGKGMKRRRAEEEEVEEHEEVIAKRAKKKKDEEAGSEREFHDGGSGAPKAKHPNQYTYRPKVPGQPDHPTLSPVKTQHSPVKKANPESSIRKVAATLKEPRGSTPAASSKANTPTAIIGPFTWGLPDHLLAFGSLLPEAAPGALEVYTPIPRPSKQAREPPAIKIESHMEPPHKVRYPAKRMTVGEMKKRVRGMLEFVGRVQTEEGKRGERARLLGLGKVVKEVEPIEDIEMGDPATEAAEPPPIIVTTVPTSSTPQSLRLMDELTRDLIRFQEQFEAGTLPPAALATPATSGVALGIPASVAMTVSASEATQATDISTTTTMVATTVPVMVVSEGEVEVS